MKQIKVVVISLVIFYTLLQTIALLIPSHVIVSRALDMKASKAKIMAQIDSFQKWEKWNSGFYKGLKINYSEDGTEAKIENLRMKMYNKSDSLIQYQILHYKQPMLAHIKLLNHDSISSVQWQYTLQLKWYPWQRFKGVFADNMYGTQLDSNLTALKKIVEN